MAALTANIRRQQRNTATRREIELTITTSAVIFDGALLVHVAAGTLSPAANAAATYFAGMAEIENAQSSGPGITGDGTKKIKAVTGISVLCPLEAGLTAADVGKALWAQDDGTMGTTVTNGPMAGALEEFVAEAGSWVALGAPALTVSP